MKKHIYALLCTSLLVIPFLSMAQQFSWAATERYSDHNTSESVGTDKNGNVYITGRYYATYHNSAPIGASFSKYTENGVLLWKDTIAGVTFIKSIVDAEGFITSTGYFGGTAVFGNFTLSPTNSSYNGFITKYNASGTCVWAKKQHLAELPFVYRNLMDFIPQLTKVLLINMM